MTYDGDGERDRDKRPRAQLQGEADDQCYEAESHEAGLEDTWNEMEKADAWDHSTLSDSTVWEQEDGSPEEMFCRCGRKRSLHVGWKSAGRIDGCQEWRTTNNCMEVSD